MFFGTCTYSRIYNALFCFSLGTSSDTVFFFLHKFATHTHTHTHVVLCTHTRTLTRLICLKFQVCVDARRPTEKKKKKKKGMDEKLRGFSSFFFLLFSVQLREHTQCVSSTQTHRHRPSPSRRLFATRRLANDLGNTTIQNSQLLQGSLC